MAKLLFQGHGSCRITAADGRVIYIDPYAGKGYNLPADLILVTHRHHDHDKLDLVTQKSGCVVITNAEALTDGRHQTFVLNGITVEAVEAGNANHNGGECVGFIVTLDDVKLYFSGDTSKTKQMAAFKARQLDYALLCCDGIYNMGPEEAGKCARLIGAKHNIPIHMKPGKLFDKTLAESFCWVNKLILEPECEIKL